MWSAVSPSVIVAANRTMARRSSSDVRAVLGECGGEGDGEGGFIRIAVLAPAASSRFTASDLLKQAAMWSAVSPSDVVASNRTLA